MVRDDREGGQNGEGNGGRSSGSGDAIGSCRDAISLSEGTGSLSLGVEGGVVLKGGGEGVEQLRSILGATQLSALFPGLGCLEGSVSCLAGQCLCNKAVLRG